MLNTAVRYNKT